MDRGQDVATIMIDLSKAFNTVNHTLLVAKLQAYGIREGELLWIKDYLSNRKQRVVMDGTVADWNEVKNGVPQGSILGPLLLFVFLA